jgi:hypothetical protein
VGELVSRKMVSVRGRGFEARVLARGTSSMRRSSMHVVERKEERGSEEPAGAGTRAVVSNGREAMSRDREDV